MGKQTRPTIELSEAEEQMIALMRQWAGDDDCRLLIERRDGAWDITLSMSPHHDKSRGTGAAFDEAWDNMNPTWA